MASDLDELPKPMLVLLFERIAEIMDLTDGQTASSSTSRTVACGAGRPTI